MIAPDLRASRELAEAIREIHIMAGLDPNNRAPRAKSAPPLAIGVTSATFGDGKTTIAMALASSLASDFERDVTLVDADLHTHSIGREYNLTGAGLTDALNGDAELADVTHRVTGERLSVISAGSASPTDAARLARSEHLQALINRVKSTNQFVVIDLPATLESMNAPVLARRCDGVVVVVRAGHTTRRDVERVLTLLNGSKVLGVVVNRTQSAIPSVVRRTLNLKR